MRAMGTLILCTVVLSGCSPSSSGRMVTENPPADWASVLMEERGEKDLSFRNPEKSPLKVEAQPEFPGLSYWEPDPDWRYVGTVNLYPTRSRVSMMTSTGEIRPFELAGWLSFVHQGAAQNLQVYRSLDRTDPSEGPRWFLPFADLTNKTETYATGRYLDLDQQEDGRFVLDFNRAYNPFCAYADAKQFSCPVPPVENSLPIAVSAGEQLLASDAR